VITLRAGTAALVIDQQAGGRIASLTVGGTELLVTEGHSPLDWGLYPMAPWAGRVRHGRFRFQGVEHQLPLDLPPHAIHGTVYRRPWAATGDGYAVVLTTDLGHDWPWRGRAVQRIELAPDALHLMLSVEAEEEPFPASVGWHPWFRRRLDRGGPVEVGVPASLMWRRDEEGIPSGDLVPPPPGPYDDCFTKLLGPSVLLWPDALELTVESTAEHLVVFDEPEHAVCVEPQTGPPDALNLRPHVVEPDAPLVTECTLRWRRTA
jgi:aldose 1-epimerase